MSSTPPASSSGASATAIMTAAASPNSSGTMQFLGSANTTYNPQVDTPAADDMIDVGGLWTAAAAAAASPVDDETVSAASEKEQYVPATGGALGPGAKMDHDASSFEVDIGGGGSYEDLIASGVNEFFDVFRALDDGPDGGGFPEGGLNAADQGMEVDDDEFAWLNSPDAFMPLPFADMAITDLPIADVGGLGQAAATVVPTGEEEEEAGLGPGLGDDNMEEDVAGGPLVAVAGWPVPEDTPEAAPAAAAALAATTICPPVALEDDTAEGPGIGCGECAVTPAPAPYDSSGSGGGGAGYMFAGGPPDGAADVGAVGVGVAAAEVMAATPTATNMTIVNGAGGGGGSGGGGGEHDGGHAGGICQKELIRRQKVERYLAKKKRRRWSRAASYQSRQRVANDRPRHKGRFLPLVSDFVPISELKRRQRALMAQRAAEEDKQASFPTLEAPPDGSGASAQFPGGGDYGQGEG